jgi:hypothetical protein
MEVVQKYDQRSPGREAAEDVDEPGEELVEEGLHLGHSEVDVRRGLHADEELQAGDHVHQELAVGAERLEDALLLRRHAFLVL